ncbi:hypothetical protein AMTRI_Chr06g175110 [Amborella trichopoda]
MSTNHNRQDSIGPAIFVPNKEVPSLPVTPTESLSPHFCNSLDALLPSSSPLPAESLSQTSPNQNPNLSLRQASNIPKLKPNSPILSQSSAPLLPRRKKENKKKNLTRFSLLLIPKSLSRFNNLQLCQSLPFQIDFPNPKNPNPSFSSILLENEISMSFCLESILCWDLKKALTIF